MDFLKDITTGTLPFREINAFLFWRLKKQWKSSRGNERNWLLTQYRALLQLPEQLLRNGAKCFQRPIGLTLEQAAERDHIILATEEKCKS